MAKDSLVQLWRKRLDEIVHSDLTVEKWCELNHTTPRQYGYWRKKLGCEAKQRVRPSTWVAISVTEAPQAEAPPASLTLRIAGAEIDLSAGFDAALLRSIVSALGSASC